MSKRLQVIVQDPEYHEIRRAARSRRMTVAEWVRQALRMARRNEPASGPEKKLAAVRAAVRHDFPTVDVGEMIEQIESGYSSGAKT
jgi:hypothetical protein